MSKHFHKDKDKFDFRKYLKNLEFNHKAKN